MTPRVPFATRPPDTRRYDLASVTARIRARRLAPPRARLSPAERDATARTVEGTVRMWAVRFYRSRVRPAGGCHADLDDLMAAGWRGVTKALNAFDPSRRVKFNTFATRAVLGEVAREAKAIAHRLLTAGSCFTDGQWLAGADNPTEDLIADRRRVPDREPGFVERALAVLPTERYRQVVRMRLLGREFLEIAGVLGVTREAVRQTWLRALACMRYRLRREAA